MPAAKTSTAAMVIAVRAVRVIIHVIIERQAQISIHGTAAAATMPVIPVNTVTMAAVLQPILDHISPIAMILLLMFRQTPPIAAVVVMSAIPA